MPEHEPSLSDRVSKPTGRVSLFTFVLIGAALLGLQALVLSVMGLPPICRCGYVEFWHGNPAGPETSQHLSDWYTFTHVIHGFGLYFLLKLLMPRAPVGLRFVLAIGLEAGWEILENTPLVMERYRQSALARGYFGDSIINSISDSLAAMFGFVLARRLPLWSVLALMAGMELFVGYMIRDNLTLNILQLVHPNAAISRWQAGSE